jgi:carbamoyl-phosphate synthase large subunit
MGGSGGGIAYNMEEFKEICQRGLSLSPTSELLIDESLLGWKEYEMEVVRDKNDNCIIICSIENFDAMGVHTGDSITVAPAQTLTDKEYQIMRNASIAVLREIGVETGGSNVQFGLNPDNGRMVVIEMNPRVSRSSALASKATGFPIAKVAAKLAIGYTLDELSNEITGNITPASFEPSIDYVVTKIPRFTFEKFAGSDPTLTTQMKSVGEVMAIGRNFQESCQKALRGIETGLKGFDTRMTHGFDQTRKNLYSNLRIPSAERILYIGDAFRFGMTVEEVYEMTAIDPWYLIQIKDLISEEDNIHKLSLEQIDKAYMFEIKRKGFSDGRLADLLSVTEKQVRDHRHALGIYPIYKRVDTCAAEFASSTAYMYSSYDEECEADTSDKEKIIVLGSGPNRIGQGIESDYSCVHAALAMREDGFETIMVNSNPETVSTDYDTSDRLYFEPLTAEDIIEIVNLEKPKGVIIHYGGQTPLQLAHDLEEAGVPIIGTPSRAIDIAEDRSKLSKFLHGLGIKQPRNGAITNEDEAIELLESWDNPYPVLVRPSYIIGGRGIEIIRSGAELRKYLRIQGDKVSAKFPLLIDDYIENAIEIDIDIIADGEQAVVAGIMEHIEPSGVHSGDSAYSLPAYSLNASVLDNIREQGCKIAMELGIIGLMNAQFVVENDNIYVLEVNPRASRSTPFVSKCIGTSLAKVAARCKTGQTLEQQNFTKEVIPPYFSVKESVFPFVKFPGVDPVLSPEMKSTGEVMGSGKTFPQAFAKSQLGANTAEIPASGTVFINVDDKSFSDIEAIAKALINLGFNIIAAKPVGEYLNANGIKANIVDISISSQEIVSKMANKEITMIISTYAVNESDRMSDVRKASLQHKTYYSTTIRRAKAIIASLEEGSEIQVNRLQDLHS